MPILHYTCSLATPLGIYPRLSIKSNTLTQTLTEVGAITRLFVNTHWLPPF